jgi:hypothetical protein
MTLAFLDRFPSLFERSEVPASALLANGPQSSLRAIKSEATANGKMFYRLVLSE